MNKRGVWISGVCLLALVGFLSTYAFADGPRLKPKLNYSGEWNDNVHLAGSKDKKASMIYRVYPGLGLQIPLERAYSEFNYQFSYVKKEGDKNVEGHSGNALIRYSLTPRTSLGLSTDYSTDELWDTEDDSYHIWTSKCDIAHKLSSSLSTTFGYTNERYRIPKNNAYADYDDNAGSMGLGIIHSPRPLSILMAVMGRGIFHRVMIRIIITGTAA